ncbi:AT-rich interactive domain-containing protein 5A [Melanotaenia boesemani]|uniref:AT-rich interactive domain-containing protein 5A n=1 Tax=Melanotaenia boesemani TaxID=1250792 RepID=UPI001C04A98C|nr:AT-rich interactive domain-containing protein 5A [Melanotaenia boesemani]
MAQEDQSETSQQTAVSDEEKASPCVIEIHDSTTECEEEVRPNKVAMEEKTFVSRLYSFMKDKGTPIERIPHLGFKQINLWGIFQAVDKLGGYDSVTDRRLWKKVYDELGGSPGSTSAATCTRRHYERLVLPFERHIKGEEDKPLPPSKPRKPYKRNLESKVNKIEEKRKRTHSEREMDSELLPKRSPDASCQSEAIIHPHIALWAPSDRCHSDCSQSNRTTTDCCPSVNGHILQIPASSRWVSHIPTATGEVISPLEKKKRMAQASLNMPLSSQREDKERPSVIHCSQSPARASSSRNDNSSDGSPLPLSSSSSRSPSPLSVSSEDGLVEMGDKSSPSSGVPHNCSGTVKIHEDNTSVSCRRTSTDPAGQNKDTSQASSLAPTTDSVNGQIKDSAWKANYKGTAKHFTHPFLSPSSFSTSTSSFTKVIPKSGQLLRPSPIRPSYKIPQNRLPQQDNSLTCKKLNSISPWPYQAEKRERSRTMPQKVSPTQHSLPSSTATLPTSCVLSSYDKSVRDSRRQPPLHPTFLSHRMRLPQSPLMYRHMPVGLSHSALIGPTVYPYPYPIPLLNPQAGYTIPAMNPIYPHKL